MTERKQDEVEAMSQSFRAYLFAKMNQAGLTCAQAEEVYRACVAYQNIGDRSQPRFPVSR